ncbi:MAG TPA: PAS domain S-box protein, partial [Candidatus Eisenbacteria bacterium]|nr:PAS domain S-box protein [Candidatus Eisenbacteria bacterium]
WMRQTARVSPLHSHGQVCGVIVVIEDVTQRENQAEILARQHHRDEVLSWALSHFLKSSEPGKTVRRLFFKIAEHLDFDSFFLYLRDLKSGSIHLNTSGGVSKELQKRFANYELLTAVANEEEAIVFNAIRQNPDPQLNLLQEAGLSSAIAIPLRVDDKSLGSLCFASCGRDTISADESELLTTIGQYLATAVDKENTNKEFRRINEANKWMGAMVEFSDDAIISKDLNGIIKSCNQGAAQLFGYDIEELIGRPMRTLIPEDRDHEETNILERIRRGERIEHFETIRRRKDGSLIEVSLMISPVIDESGKVIGASKIARDITERRHAEQKLNESFQREKLAREKAEMANRAKDDFLASLSHELRTPLNPILLLASDASENSDLSPEVKANFEIIRKNIELEARLIDDLLDITRIVHGKLSLHQRVVGLQSVLEETIRNVQPEFSEKQILVSLEFQCPQRHVFGDDVRLQQVFWNVLRNAVKFTPRGGRIGITVKAVAGKLHISFTDTGVGIAPAEIQKIFEAFAQGDNAQNTAHRFGGLGLGLAIARKLVEMHSGRIFATSEGKGKGSTFTIELPAVEPALPKVPPPASNPGAELSGTTKPAMCILLVEDHEPTRTALSHLLLRRGYKVIPVASASEARSVAAAEKIDLVISDISLPDGNGNDLMQFLSTQYNLGGIAMTGYGMEEDIEKARKSGFLKHLTKPVSIRTLETAVASLLSQ